MKHATSIFLALFGLAAVAPAQFRVEGSFGRHVQVGVQVGPGYGYGYRAPVCVVPVANHGRHDFRSFGHWQTITEPVHVPGFWTEECVPARYGWVYDHCGRRIWGVVEQACCRRVWVPPRCETVTRRVWVRC